MPSDDQRLRFLSPATLYSMLGALSVSRNWCSILTFRLIMKLLLLSPLPSAAEHAGDAERAGAVRPGVRCGRWHRVPTAHVAAAPCNAVVYGPCWALAVCCALYLQACLPLPCSAAALPMLARCGAQDIRASPLLPLSHAMRHSGTLSCLPAPPFPCHAALRLSKLPPCSPFPLPCCSAHQALVLLKKEVDLCRLQVGTLCAVYWW